MAEGYFENLWNEHWLRHFIHSHMLEQKPGAKKTAKQQQPKVHLH